MDSIKARENIEINGGDDVDVDISIEPHPTRCDVKTISTIGNIEDSYNPTARKLEILLGSFNCRQLDWFFSEIV